jgi:hypothetical protein
VVFNAFNIRNVTNTFNTISNFFPSTTSGKGPLVTVFSTFEINALAGDGTAVVNTSYLMTADYNQAQGAASAIRRNGVNAGSGFRTNGLADTSTGILLGLSGGWYGAITAFEFICYTTDVSTGIAPIETNINNYYKIY